MLPSTGPLPERRAGVWPFLCYLVVFHAVWALWPSVGYPRLLALGERTFTYAAANLALRVAIWVLPVIVYLRYVDEVDPIAYLRLNEHAVRGLKVAAAITAIDVAGSIARFGAPHLHAERITWNSVIGTSFLVGFIEEIPYRGFMLRKLTEYVGFWPAALITSLLFVWVHVPGWIALHVFTPGAAVSIFVLALVFACAVRWSGSLWAAIAAHSANDCLSVLLFGR